MTSVGNARVGNGVSVRVEMACVGEGWGVDVSSPGGSEVCGSVAAGASVAAGSVAAGSGAVGDSGIAGNCVGAGAAPPQDVTNNAKIRIMMIRRIIQTHFRTSHSRA